MKRPLFIVFLLLEILVVCIYRHVWMRVTDPVNIPVWGVAVTPPEVSDKKVTVSAEVSVENNGNSHVDITVKNTVFSPGRMEDQGMGMEKSFQKLELVRQRREKHEGICVYKM